jgi:hypothetical protein
MASSYTDVGNSYLFEGVDNSIGLLLTSGRDDNVGSLRAFILLTA